MNLYVLGFMAMIVCSNSTTTAIPAIKSLIMGGKTCLITDGIGYAAARELALRGVSVIAVGRNAPKTHGAAMCIIAETGNDGVSYFVADLSSQSDVRRLAEQVRERTAPLDGMSV